MCTFMKDPNNLKKSVWFPHQISFNIEWMEPCGKAEGWIFEGLWKVDEQSGRAQVCGADRWTGV